MIFDVVLALTKQLISELADAVAYVLCDRVEDPIAICHEEDEEHLHVTAIEKSRLVR